MAGKPEKKIKEPEGPKHAPKPKKPRHPLLAAAAIGATLIGGSCAPSARAQETTPPRPATIVQRQGDRTVSAEARGTQTAPETRVAQAPAQTQVRSDTTAAGAGSMPPYIEGAAYTITGAEQPQVLTAQEAREEYAYMFRNELVTARATLPEGGQKTTIGDWEIETLPYGPYNTPEYVVRNRNLGYEATASSAVGSQLLLLPFPETNYAKGPMLIIVGSGYSTIFLFNKLTGRVGVYGFDYPRFSSIPEIGTDVYNNEPYLALVAPGSLTSEGNLRSGTKIYQLAIRTTWLDGDGPGGAVGYFRVE